jgi:endonuclease/exonuclease/phosphatase family metal-dependent hydrolase
MTRDPSTSPHQAPGARSCGQRLHQIIVRPLVQGLQFCLLAGVLIRLSVKDSQHFIGLIYYALPLPVLMTGSLLAMLLAWSRQRWKTGMFWMAMAGLLVPWWIQHDWKSARRPEPAGHMPPVTVMFWNVARQSNLEPALQLIRQTRPQILGLAELTGSPRERSNTLKQQLPGYDVSILGSNLYLLIQGTSGITETLEMGGSSVARRIPVHLQGHDLDIVIVDIDSHLARPRRPAIQQLAEFARPRQAKPVLIMGDFNLPADSVHFRFLQESFRQLFASAGQGSAPTWPVPVPVLELDQIWISDGLKPVSCRHLWSWASDHRPVLGTVEFTE